MLETIRKKGPRLYLFRPVEDLSVFSDSDPAHSMGGRGSGQPIATELEKYVIKSRQGTVLVPHTILKIDFWSKSIPRKGDGIDGAANFR